ncbi:MAG: hypothetical protein OEY11_05680 [Gammaproteobacteria bacterium]|nr:hypothetical protein [Gammaproteobacteria bacterium]
MIFRIMLLCVLVTPVSALAEQRIKLESSKITGNSELPKILYVVPWKKVAATQINYQLAVHGIRDDMLKPVDPEEFQRQVRNYTELLGNQIK